MADPKTYRVLSLPEPLHAFLADLMERVVREGLLVPDELPFAAGLWDRVKNAQVVQMPEPAPQEPPPPASAEGGVDV